MLGTTIAATTKVTTKVDICSNGYKMVATTTIAECKLEFTHNIPNIIIVTKTIGLAIKPSQTKVTTRSVEP